MESGHLAVLVYVACQEPEPRVPRDALLSTFWPQSKARLVSSSLSRTLTVVREAVGGDVLVARDDDEVEVDRERIWCDVWDFREALLDEAWDAACALHEGRFLDGFAPTGHVTFDSWVDRTRRRLDAQAATAWIELAGAAAYEGRGEAAVDSLRKALEATPYNEAIIRHLVGALIRRGDRGSAAAAYTDFARQMRNDLDLEPTTSTRHYVRDLLQKNRPGADTGNAGHIHPEHHP